MITKLYKQLCLPVLVLLLAVGGNSAKAQVKIGDNPTVIGQSSILELESKNKSLLLTRLADTTKVAAPVNGMLIYDISRKCVTGYQDGKWSPCLGSSTDDSSGNGNNPGNQWATKLTFKDISSCPGDHTTGSNTATMAISTAGNVYAWGNNAPNTITSMQTGSTPVWSGTMSGMYSPVWQKSSLFNGKAKKVQVTSAIGGLYNVYSVLTTDGKLYIYGYTTSPTLPIPGYSGLANSPVQAAMPAGATAITDYSISTLGYSMACIDNNGKAWFFNTLGSGSNTTNWQQIAFPAGVTSYSKIWIFGYDFGGANGALAFAYMLGNDNNLYATGTKYYGSFGDGTEGSAATTNIILR